jgi:hypothetical protein
MENFIPTLAIVRKHLRISHNSNAVEFIAMKLAPYYENLALLDATCPEVVEETIYSDYRGLVSNDKSFVPRLG